MDEGLLSGNPDRGKTCFAAPIGAEGSEIRKQ